jgi:hypothetical protein
MTADFGKLRLRSTNVLEWWHSKEQDFPLLSKVAKKYLCIQVSSTSSERVFSTGGNTVTAKRTKLDPTNVHMIVYCNINYDKVKIQSWKIQFPDCEALEQDMPVDEAPTQDQ